MDPDPKFYMVEGMTEPPPAHHLPFLLRASTTKQRYLVTLRVTKQVIFTSLLFSVLKIDARVMFVSTLATLLIESAWRGLDAWSAWRLLQKVRQADEGRS